MNVTAGEPQYNDNDITYFEEYDAQNEEVSDSSKIKILMTEFFKLPNAVKRKFEIRLIFLLIVDVCVGILLIKGHYSFYSALAILLLNLFLGFNIYGNVKAAIENGIISFTGKVISCTNHGFPNVNQYFTVTLYNEEKEKNLSFIYHKDIDLDKIITVYMRKMTPIIEGENGPQLKRYVTIQFGEAPTEIEKDLYNESTTADDYLN